jgi:polyhydroxybutyrate depolymerase
MRISILRLVFPAVTALIVLLAAAASSTLQAQTGECSPAGSGSAIRAAVETGSTSHTLTSGGIERTYIAFVPEGYDPAVPTPVVISLHGYTSSALQQQLYTGWDDIAERETFLAVYPQGVGSPTRWHAYERRAWFVTTEPVDDVQFISDLLDQLEGDYCVDAARVYANGLSNGGGMAHRLACDLGERIAAIGTVAGAFIVDDPCDPARPMPVMAFHGTDDAIAPYAGANVLMGAPDWVSAWAQRLNCDAEPVELEAQGEVSGVEYTGCDDDVPVIFYTINGGGHTWPGALPVARLGATTQDISASEALWEFFADHPLPMPES